jgi:prepilin-type N-terminal cleavage/methylation domain-containing protein
MRSAFTLVELLVVITIIVVLLALLAPALDQAVYQAELTLCSANLRAIATTSSLYAADHKRAYPHRSGVFPDNDNIVWWPDQVRDPRDGGVHDDRPELRPYMDINKMLNCPLVADVDLTRDGGSGTTLILANYELYFGWGYRNSVSNPRPNSRPPAGAAMIRLGDRWESDAGFPPDHASGLGRRYNMSLIAADVEYENFNSNNSWSSHPDKAGALGEMAWQNYGDPSSGADTDPNGASMEQGGAAAYGALLGYPILSMTWSRWDARFGNVSLLDTTQTWRRGPVDRNFAYADGAVFRINDILIKLWEPDPRMIFTSQNSNAYNNLHHKHLPKP